MHALNAIIMDTDNELGRLSLGKEITRPRKRTTVGNHDRRSAYKLKLATGSYTPWEHLNAISHTIGTISPLETELSDSSDESEVDVESGRDNNNCVVCLTSRETTWVFIPCRHALCCSECSKKIQELGKPCPVCRSPIDSSFQITINNLSVSLIISIYLVLLIISIYLVLLIISIYLVLLIISIYLVLHILSIYFVLLIIS